MFNRFEMCLNLIVVMKNVQSMVMTRNLDVVFIVNVCEFCTMAVVMDCSSFRIISIATSRFEVEETKLIPEKAFEFEPKEDDVYIVCKLER